MSTPAGTPGAPPTTDPPKNDPAPVTDPPKADPPKADPAKTFTQAELDAIVTDRLTRERKKYGDYDDLKAKAAKHDQVVKDQETESQKAIREATEKAEAEATAKVRPLLVAAEFRAEAAGRIDAARLATLTEDIDMSRYLNPDGSIDTAKIKTKIDAWAPAVNAPKPGQKPDPSQGAGTGGKSSGMQAGREMHAARRGKNRKDQ